MQTSEYGREAAKEVLAKVQNRIDKKANYDKTVKAKVITQI